MQSPMIHIHITCMMNVHHFRLVTINALFNVLDQVETIYGIQAIVRKIEKFNSCCPEN